MKKNIPETRKYRLEMNDKILNSGFRDFNKFFALDNKAYVEGALPVKMKELMGLLAQWSCAVMIAFFIISIAQFQKVQQKKNSTKLSTLL